jgi:hypothetical protein
MFNFINHLQFYSYEGLCRYGPSSLLFPGAYNTVKTALVLKTITYKSLWSLMPRYKVAYSYTLVLLLSIDIQILEIPICQKNSHVS